MNQSSSSKVSDGFTGVSLVTGLSTVVGLTFACVPGFIPGAEDGGGPLLFLGVNTFIVTGFSTAVFLSSTAISFLIGVKVAVFWTSSTSSRIVSTFSSIASCVSTSSVSITGSGIVVSTSSMIGCGSASTIGSGDSSTSGVSGLCSISSFGLILSIFGVDTGDGTCTCGVLTTDGAITGLAIDGLLTITKD